MFRHAMFRFLAMLFFTFCLSPAWGAEYFVSKTGNDARDGLSLSNAFATIQKGIDVLQSGDTLTIAPGEYFQSAHREKFGSEEKETTIRAQIPGTVLLRGDVPLSNFKKLAAHRAVYLTAFDQSVQTINEVDTLNVLKRVPNIAEIDIAPNRYFFDDINKQLYLSASDWGDATEHVYTATCGNVDGLYFANAKRLVIDGLAFTGFNNTMPDRFHPTYRHRFTGGGAFWGLLIGDCQSCIIRNCTAYLNGGGIGVEYTVKPEEIGVKGNLVERCVAYGNYSQLYSYEASAIGVYQSNNDEIRDCYTYKNWGFGSRFYIKTFSPGKLTGTITWGNLLGSSPVDLQIKANPEISVERCVALGWAAIETGKNNIIPAPNALLGNDSIPLINANQSAVDQDREFADPANMDFHLQADSQFRGTGPEGKDRGPNPYVANIFYLSNKGNDEADGLSVRQAWKTFSRAASQLKAGDTLYLEPGDYHMDSAINTHENAGNPISICGRGKLPVVISGELAVLGDGQLAFARLNFRDTVRVNKTSATTFNNCSFTSQTLGLEARQAQALRVSHCTFTKFQEAAIALEQCGAVQLSGNLFDNKNGVALQVDNDAQITYSDYNSYSQAEKAWKIAEKTTTLTQVQLKHDVYSRELPAEFSMSKGQLVLKNTAQFAVGGGLAKPFGTYRDEPRAEVIKIVEGPKLHSVSATTANIEWLTSQPTTCDIRWGETPECENKDSFDVNHVASYSLTGLSPGKKYYFQIKSISKVRVRYRETLSPPVEVKSPLLTFTTDARIAAPKKFFVAVNGDDSNTGLDREHAWKTIQNAADHVNAGDTVFIAAGRYKERVRMRATGDKNQPITFQCLPGEKVVIDGAGRSLSNTFVVCVKKNLRFDGFYIINTNMSPDSGNFIERAGEFLLYATRDIQISRIFSDGRGAYSAPFVLACKSEKLSITNTVNINKMGAGMYFERCPDLRVDHNVFACPMIAAIIHRNERNEKADMDHNIFTDMLEKKAVQNFSLLVVDGYPDSFRQKNNCYLVRCFPPEQRKIMNEKTISEMGTYISDALFADPAFAAVVPLIKPGTKQNSFTPDLVVDPSIKLDFNSYFTTNPELIKRGIGLQPDAFSEFHFETSYSTAN